MQHRHIDTYDKAQQNRGDATADETFPGLFRRQLDQRCLAEEEAKDVGHHIVDYDHRHGHNEPNQSLEHVLYDQIRLGNHNQQSHVGPGKLCNTKLVRRQ